MSRPYQFAEDKSTRSPLDRQPQNLYPAGQPPSFQTNVNRAKTKRWVEAKTVNYDGDDWGEYDEYDEYGANDPEPEPAAAPSSNSSGPTGLRQKGQSVAEAGRSFTEPQPPRQPSISRKNSFDAGDERRAFSSAAPQGFAAASTIAASAIGRNGGIGGTPPPPSQPYAAHTINNPQPINTQVPPASRQPSASAQSDFSDTPQHRRDFSPSALPPPLHTKVSSVPGSASASPAGTRFPPRKSSVSSPSEVSGPLFPPNVPATGSAQPPLRTRTPSNPTKPLPFIRPSDIYKRVEEERFRERQSLDSGRPSMDSLSRQPTEEATGPGLQKRTSAESLGRGMRRPSVERLGDASESGRSLQPLAPVAERKSEYLPDFNLASQAPQPSSAPAPQRPVVSAFQPIALLEVQKMSGFAEDFSPRYFSPDEAAASRASTNLSQQESNDPELQNIVDQAFTRKDDGSVPPTPLSKRGPYSQSEEGISRSNTESSSGISPIMSRVPSSATSALKARSVGGAETTTPAIAEETSEANTPTSRPPSGSLLGGGYKVNRKPSPAHSRNVSSGSLVGTPPHQTGLHTPSPGESPARSPAIEAHKELPGPEAAVLGNLSPLLAGNNENTTLPNYATREADIAHVAKKSPETPGFALGEVEKESQQEFLESHKGISDVERPPRSRSESPSKGRVQELAGKFGAVPDSRRSSTHSSIASWERNEEDLPSTNKSKPRTRDSSPVKEPLSQRPAAVTEPSFRPKLPGQWESYATNTPTPMEEPSKDRQMGGRAASFAAPVSNPDKKDERDEDIDLTPTTQRHSAAPPKSDPLAALQAAGTAMGEALKASVGMGTTSPEPEKSSESQPKAALGDFYLRPLQPDRPTSSVASSNSPSPPPKDDDFTPSSDMYAPPPFKEKTPVPESPATSKELPIQPSMVPQLSTDPSAHDQESDRLRKEIVRSLSPLKQSDAGLPDKSRSSLQPGAPPANRESSILPSEYDSYWADGGDTDRQSVVQPSYSTGIESNPLAAQNASEPKPGLQDNRFSWEKSLDPLPPVMHAPTIPTSQPEPVLSPPTRGAVESPRSEAYAGIPEPYFGPAHATPSAPIIPHIAELEPKAEDKSLTDPAEVNKKAESPTLRQSNELNSPSSHDRRSSLERLHVVNSAVDPEAVDIPPQLAERVEADKAADKEAAQEAAQKVEGAPQQPRPLSEIPLGPRPPTSKGVQPASISGKPLTFRDIVAIRSAPDRIATYNKTRDYWATTDHGLNEWMAKAVAANPELASPTLTSLHTTGAPGSIRHRPTASISLFGKSAGANAQPTTPYYQQYNAAASHLPPGAPPTTPGGTPQQGTLSTGGTGTRMTSQQLEKKGKDLLHTAELFGGKATTGVKGLFAKGKSRFGKSSGSIDKASRSSISSAPTSREPSEEPPEWVSNTTPQYFDKGKDSADMGRSSVDQADPSFSEKKKKRRLSSPFRRSRSRPNSFVLPKHQNLDLANTNGSIHSRDTPPRETPPDSSRPHSYAAPDSWNFQELPPQQNANLTTPPRNLDPPNRLGVLPSPAKSAFSLKQAEREEDVPPVPAIPHEMEDWERQREQQAHRNLQSVVRHSTPPVLETFRAQSVERSRSTERRREGDEEHIHFAQVEEGDLRAAEGQIAVGAKKEPSWPLRSNPPSPETGDQLVVAPMIIPIQSQEADDDDDRPPQLNHKPVLASATAPVDAQVHQGTDDDEDDRQPQLNYEPMQVLATGPNHTQNQYEVSDDEDDRPPPLNHGSLPSSAPPAHTQVQRRVEDDDDDDRPPQLQHDPLPTTALPGHMRQPLDVSPTSAPQASDIGDISPVVSSVGQDVSDDDDRAPPPLDMNFLSRNAPPVSAGPDVSPILAPQAGFASDERQGAGIRPGTATPTMRPDFETEKIGLGDVSPVSDHGEGFSEEADETTPTKPVVAQSGDCAVATPGAHIPGAFIQTPMETPGQPYNQTGRQLGADRAPSSLGQDNAAAPASYNSSNPGAGNNPVHSGVDDYEPSRASTDSWEHDSIGEQLTHNQHLPGRHDSQEGVAIAVTPQSARAINVGGYFRPQDTDQAQRQAAVQQQPLQNLPAQERTIPQVLGPAQAPPQPPQAPPPVPAGGHKRSQSLLSTISHAVSAEGLGNSPVSATSARSRPTSGNPHMPTISAGTAIDVPPQPQPQVQVAHSAVRQQNSAPLSPTHDGLDLYADHNGIVKDLHDERTGQPLRVIPVSSAPMPPTPPQAPPPVFAPSPEQVTQGGVTDSPITKNRGLGSRPMSFISLPRDAKGRPQEQINREIQAEEVRRESVSAQLQPQPQQQSITPTPAPPVAQNGAVVQPAGMAGALQKEIGVGRENERQSQILPPPQAGQMVQGQQAVVPQGQTVQSPPPQQQQALGPQGQMVQSPQQQQPTSPPQGPYGQDPKLQDPRSQDPRMQDPRMMQDPRLQDPRMQQMRMQDPRTQDPILQNPRMENQDPRAQAMLPGQAEFQDPRQQGPPQGQNFQPQDPTFQGRPPGQMSPWDPRMHGGQLPPPRNEYEAQQQTMHRQAMDPRLLGTEYKLPGVGPPPKEGRSNPAEPGRPKLGSVFKGLGSRHTPPPAQVPNNRINPNLQAPDDQQRAFSYQSSVGDLPTEPLKEKKKERKTSIFSSLSSRPQSVGTESQFSQESRVAHAADSRIDLRYPTSPAPFKGIPPQDPPPGASQPPKPAPQRASTSLVPDGGKKRRFSGLGSLFHRHGSTGHVAPTKPQKLSKEEKKKQKAAAGLAPILQAQQPQRPVQGYGQPPVFPQQYGPPPGMVYQGQGMLQPQGVQQHGPPQQRVSQQYVPPQGQGMSQPYGVQQSVLPQQRVSQQYMPPLQQMPPQPPPGVQGYATPPRTDSLPPQGAQGYTPPPRANTQPPPGVRGYGPQHTDTLRVYQQPQNPQGPYGQPQPQPPQLGQQQSPLSPQSSTEAPRYPSAYGETRQLAQAAVRQPSRTPSNAHSVSPAPSQPSRQISPQNGRPGPPPANHSFEHTVARIDEHGEHPPPGGYYAPNNFSHMHGNVGFGAIAQEAAIMTRPENQRRVSSATRPENERRVSSPTSGYGANSGVASPVSQRSVSSPIPEPRYEAPPIPAAYGNGADGYSGPQSRASSLPNQFATAARKTSSPSPYTGPTRQYSDPHRPGISPQVSGQSQYDAGGYREPATPPVVSPVSQPSPGMSPQPNQQRRTSSEPRMGSISEATHQERPYNISLPIDEGVENEAAYIRQQQMIQQQIDAQNQAQGSRNGHTPSPSLPPQGYGRPSSVQGLAGFREVLPRHSPQPYQMPPPQPQQPISHPQHTQLQPPSRTEPVQPAPIHPHQLQTSGGPVQPAAYPLPISPAISEARSPVNPIAAALPPPSPPKVPHSPFVPHHPGNDVVDDEAPPSYSTHEGQGTQGYPDEKASQPRSPTTKQLPPQMSPPPQIPMQHQQHGEYVPGDGPNERGRKPSVSILQHPQPSTMAASPSRSSTDMGSAILRQQLLVQEERERVERLQRTEQERIENERERAERERARARARELERSRGSLRSPILGASGERGRPVAFELSAEEDDEPVMRGASYPGMEWTPAWDGVD